MGNQGLSIPARGPSGQFALLSCNANTYDDACAKFIELNQQSLVIIAHKFNERALDFDTGFDNAVINLSPRELSARALLARGHSRSQVAHELQISEHTLRGALCPRALA